MFDPSIPWVLLRIRNQLFGVPASHIREMAEMPGITHVPNMPDYVLGLISLRGQVTPTIDLRRRLGMPSADSDLTQLTAGLEDAAAEHRHLAENLAQAARTGGGAPDCGISACPLHCWLEGLQMANPLVRLYLKKLEGPHALLHEAAMHVAAVATSSPLEAEGAFHRFQEKELAAFDRLIPHVRERLVHAFRQIVVVFMMDGRTLGAAADEVESIERLREGSIDELPAHLRSQSRGLTRLVGRRTRDDEIVLILEVKELFHGTTRDGAWMEEAAASSVEGELQPVGAVASGSSAAAHSVGSAGPPAAGRNEEMVGAGKGSAYAEGITDRGWCGDPRGSWVQLAEGPVVDAGPAWSRESEERSG